MPLGRSSRKLSYAFWYFVVGLGLVAMLFKAGTYYIETRVSAALDRAIRDSEVVPTVNTVVAVQPTSSATTVSARPAAVIPEEPVATPSPTHSVAPRILAQVIQGVETPTAPTPLKVAAAVPNPLSVAELPDLAITEISVSPPNPTRGQPITGFIRGINQGSASASKIQVRIDLEHEIVGRWVHLATVQGTVDELGPGQEISVERTATVPDQAPTGKYRVIVNVDPEHRIAELSTENNRGSVDFALR